MQAVLMCVYVVQRLKYQSADFGYCPRVLCGGNQPVLPVGQSDNPCHQTVSVYCPLCGDIYAPKSSRAARTCIHTPTRYGATLLHASN